MGYFEPVLLVFVGLAVGGLAAWLVMRGKARHEYERGRSEGEVARASLEERLVARQKSIEDLDARRLQVESQVRELQLAEASVREKAVELQTTLDQERKQAEEKLAVINEAQRKLADAFKALAAEALKSNNQSFLELAKATLETFQEAAKGDLEKRQQAIHELVKPVKESLDKVDSKINELEKARSGAYQGLTEQVRSLMETQQQLRSETSNLVKALRRPEIRGRWGEIQLKRAVELAGMLPHCDFYEQPSTDTEEGRLRPDMVVRLPGNFNIVVDSKAPLDAYLDAVEAPDDETRKQKLADHARQVRTHITALARRSYPEQFAPALDYVVLFLPGEVFFRAAVECDPQLIEFGIEEKVMLASPMTLICLLRTVACGWRQEALAENAKRISDLGRELYERLASVSGHIQGLRKNLKSTVEAYDKAVGSLESRVLVSARKFKDLGVSAGETEIEELTPLGVTPRALQAPEMLPASGEQPEG